MQKNTVLIIDTTIFNTVELSPSLRVSIIDIATSNKVEFISKDFSRREHTSVIHRVCVE